MRATLNKTPFDLTLLVDGEEWKQGESVRGKLIVKNVGRESIDLSKIGVTLNYAKEKKISTDGLEAFSEMEKTSSLPSALAAGESVTIPYHFTLSETAPIRDKNGSLYLRFGHLESSEQSSHLELNIKPHPYIETYLHLLHNFKRFTIKDSKFIKNLIEVKLIPPKAREYANMTAVILQIAFTNNELQMKYSFALEKLGETLIPLTSGSTTKYKKDYVQVLNTREFLQFGDSINQDFLVKKLDEALTSVKPTLL